MAQLGKPTSRGRKTTTKNTEKEEKAIVAVEDSSNTRAAPTKKVLGNLHVSTELYTGADIDALLEANRLIEDEDIPGDFYFLSIKSGRLIIRKVASAES